MDISERRKTILGLIAKFAPKNVLQTVSIYLISFGQENKKLCTSRKSQVSFSKYT
jgi:hypothetical protein